MLIHHLFDFHTRLDPAAPCVVFEGETLSYEWFLRRSKQFASGLQSLGVGKGDRVAFLAENCPECVILLLAVARIGAVAVPLNYRLAAPELTYILRDANTRVLYVPGAGMNHMLVQLRSELPEGCVVIATGNAGDHDAATWMDAQSDTPAATDILGTDPFIQLYTSGTTGNPKGVVSSHNALYALSAGSRTGFPARPEPGAMDLVCAPNFHISGTGSMLVPLLNGAALVLHKTFDPNAVVRDLESLPINNVFMVPAMIMAILQLVPDIEKKSFPNLTQIGYGASPISPTVLRKAMSVFSAASFVQVYGMTETTGTVVALLPDDHRRALAGEEELLQSCGRPQPGVEVRIVDRDGRDLPDNETGELWIRSDMNMLGYFNLPAETAKNFSDGWIHTGDSGFRNTEGYIFLRDRIKDMVVSGGENIYPVEVENVIAAMPQVQDVAVIGVPDEKFGEALLACVALKEGQALAVEELIAYCRDHLAGYKIPRQLTIVEELPRNPSGKILKKELRKPYWEGAQRNIA